MNGFTKINSLYAIIYTDDDGTEGIPSILTPIPLPFVTPDKEKLPQFLKFAADMAKKGNAVRVVEFTSGTTINAWNAK